MTNITAVYAGSYDPVTAGHIDIFERASAAFPYVIGAIGKNPGKTGLFTVPERLEMLSRATSHLANVKVVAFDGLLVDYCKSVGSKVIVRGLRAVTDFEFELGLAHANSQLEPKIDTVFFPTRPEFSFVSSSMIRQFSMHGRSVEHFAPKFVSDALLKKFSTIKGG